MAVLNEGNRRDIWRDYMSELSSDRESVAISKADLRAAVDAIDDWINNNAASFNSSIPQPARNELTAKQKAAILAYVVNKRWEVE